MIYPTQKAVAFRVNYSRNWKAGEQPVKVKLGSLLFPVGEHIEFADQLVRKQFPQANSARLYDETGALFCTGVI